MTAYFQQQFIHISFKCIENMCARIQLLVFDKQNAVICYIMCRIVWPTLFWNLDESQTEFIEFELCQIMLELTLIE